MSLKTVLWVAGGIAAVSAIAYGAYVLTDEEEEVKTVSVAGKDDDTGGGDGFWGVHDAPTPPEPTHTVDETDKASEENPEAFVVPTAAEVITPSNDSETSVVEQIKAYIIEGYSAALPADVDVSTFLHPHQKALGAIAEHLVPLYNKCSGFSPEFAKQSIFIINDLIKTNDDVKELDNAMQVQTRRENITVSQTPTSGQLKLDDILAQHKEAVDRLKDSFKAISESNMAPDVKRAVAGNAYDVFLGSKEGEALLQAMVDAKISRKEISLFFRSICGCLKITEVSSEA